MLIAQAIGGMRNITAIEKGRKHIAGFGNGSAWNNHIEGAAGELAVAKVLDVYWGGSINTFKKGGDVGDLQVRTSLTHEDLIVRPHDSDSAIFVLVLGPLPTVQVKGWMYGYEAKQEKWLARRAERTPAYFVPNKELRSIEELKEMLHESNRSSH